MSTPAEPTRSCRECAVGLAADQRYCLACGARTGPQPPALRQLLAQLLPGTRHPAPARALPAAPAARALPSPRAGAVLVLGLLAFGVVVGAAAGSRAGDTLAASVRPPLRIVLPPPAPASPATAVPAIEPAPTPAPAAPAAAAPSAAPAPAPSKGSAPASGGGQVDTPTTTGGGGGSTTTSPAPRTLPPIKHVFVVMLADEPYGALFAPGSAAPYLARTLASQGVLLPRYYAVAHDELANEIALVSGQAPTPQTAFNCPVYSDVTATGAGPAGSGQGCVYPRTTPTLADQLVIAHRSWRAYAQDMGAAAPSQPASCRHPPLGSPDPTQTARPGDGYATYRDPFAYFHSLIDDPACAADQVGLDHLSADLAAPDRTPALSYIVPSLCFDGRPAPCPAAAPAPGSPPPAALPAGPAAADAFLRLVVPSILGSAAYRDGGMLVITTDQAPTAGPGADSSSCCGQPRFPTTAGTAAGTPGGGDVGALVISPYVRPGTVDQDAYNHFSLLRTIEDLFSIGHLGHAADAGVSAFDGSVFGRYSASGSSSATSTGTATTTSLVRRQPVRRR